MSPGCEAGLVPCQWPWATLPYYKDTNPGLADNARYTIGEVLTDYRGTSDYL